MGCGFHDAARDRLDNHRVWQHSDNGGPGRRDAPLDAARRRLGHVGDHDAQRRHRPLREPRHRRLHLQPEPGNLQLQRFRGVRDVQHDQLNALSSNHHPRHLPSIAPSYRATPATSKCSSLSHHREHRLVPRSSCHQSSTARNTRCCPSHVLAGQPFPLIGPLLIGRPLRVRPRAPVLMTLWCRLVCRVSSWHAPDACETLHLVALFLYCCRRNVVCRKVCMYRPCLYP